MLPRFPVWALSLPKDGCDSGEVISRFLSLRPDESWLLAGQPALSCERQLWAAWLALTRRNLAGNMRSKGVDGEFLRLIAGTHHVAQGFRRAGISDGDSEAWLVHIPSTENPEILPDVELSSLDITAQKLIAGIGAGSSESRPSPTSEGLVRLGIFTEAQIDDLQQEQFSEYFIGHINSADLFN